MARKLIDLGRSPEVIEFRATLSSEAARRLICHDATSMSGI